MMAIITLNALTVIPPIATVTVVKELKVDCVDVAIQRKIIFVYDLMLRIPGLVCSDTHSPSASTSASSGSTPPCPDTVPGITINCYFVGIPANQTEKLFSPFFQVDSSATRKHGGTGLGNFGVVALLCCEGVLCCEECCVVKECCVGG